MKPLADLAGCLAGLAADEGIVMHSGAAHPTRLGRLLAEAAGSLRGRRIHTLTPLGPLAYADPPARDLLEINTFLPGAGLRAAMDAGRVMPLRQPLSSVPASFAQRGLPVGAVLLRVSPPDAAGRVSLGVSVDYMPQAIAAARLVIVEIDPLMPRTMGDSWLAASDIDAFVDAADGPHEVAPACSDEAETAIAGHIASLVEDGAVLQLGVGALPDQVLARLGHLKHLGLHTGIIGQGARALIERGVIDNSTKGHLAGISVATMAFGSAGFYAFLDGNAAVGLYPCALTHDHAVLRRLGRLCAINSAMQVGLDGRVNAEWAGRRRVSLPGGLPDFARVASGLPGGRSIIALRSTGRNGASNIVEAIGGDAPASLEPHEVDFVVTEFGVASLRGRTPTQRRQALAAIAHPQHRQALAAA
ncbi:MAG: acetyl-CoA hydrolase/transferase C-terminal domain-containing protein [Pseudomonadota bacterium]